MSWTRRLWPYPVRLTLRFTCDIEGDSAGRTSQDEDGLVRVDIRPSSDQAVEGTAAHEAVHVAQFVGDWVGGRLDDETEAYLVQGVWEWITGKWRESRAGKRLR